MNIYSNKSTNERKKTCTHTHTQKTITVETEGIIHHFYDRFEWDPKKERSCTVLELQWVDFLVCGLVSKPVLKYDNGGFNLTSKPMGFLFSISGILPLFMNDTTCAPFQAYEMHHHFKLHLHHHCNMAIVILRIYIFMQMHLFLFATAYKYT